MAFRVRLLVAVALPLAAADLLHKLAFDTRDWAHHPRGPLWVALVALVAVGCVALTRIPSRIVTLFAGVLAAGAVGNGVAALAWEQGVPNPLVVRTDTHIAAFNVADVFAIAGIAGLAVALIAVTITHRAILPPPRRVAQSSGRSFARRRASAGGSRPGARTRPARPRAPRGRSPG